MGQRQRPDKNPLHPIQADGIAGAIIQLGRARRLVVGNLLRVLNCTTVLNIVGVAGSAENCGSPRQTYESKSEVSGVMM
jgi:hypothetical protein